MSALHDLIYCCSKDLNDQIKQINQSIILARSNKKEISYKISWTCRPT